MKMRMVGRIRHMQGEKSLMVYRKFQTSTNGVDGKTGARLFKMPEIKLCDPLSTGLLPIGSSKEIREFVASISRRMRQPEPTVQESKQTINLERTEL